MLPKKTDYVKGEGEKDVVVTHNFTGTQGHLSDIAVSEEDVVDSEKYIAMGDENGKILVWR